jgi:hypothetical protein
VRDLGMRNFFCEWFNWRRVSVYTKQHLIHLGTLNAHDMKRQRGPFVIIAKA